MKAVDYFRKYGIVESKKHLEWMVRVEARQDIHGWFMGDLKRLVESHELVECIGGLDEAKYILRMAELNGHDYAKTRKAIKDVESCQ